MTKIDKEQVLAAVSVADYCGRLGARLKRLGHELRGHCPICGSRSRVPFCVRNDKWCCHACDTKGDVIELCRKVERVDFPEAIRRLAEIAGIQEGSQFGEEERAKLRQAREAREAELDRRAELRRLAAEKGAPSVWAGLDRSSEAGLAYLKRRGVAAAASEVRYTADRVCLPLWRDGAIVNVVKRAIDPAEKEKVRGLRGCGSLGVFGDLRRADATEGPIVIVEGVFDFLSARVLWPERLTVGAHGSGRIPEVARMVADLCRSRGAIFVPHADEVGQRKVREAIGVLQDLGVPEEIIGVFEVGEDLNYYLMERSMSGSPDIKPARPASQFGEEGEEFELTDEGSARRFVHLHRDNFRYIEESDDWIQWRDGIWSYASERVGVYRAAAQVAKQVRQEAEAATDKESERLRRYAEKIQSASRIRAIIESARSMDELQLRTEDLDSNPWLLAVENGTLDLRSGELYPHRREDLITQRAPVAYDPGARCPRWERFMQEVFEPNPDAIDFVHRFFGYSLTGKTDAQCLLFAYGCGANGKGVIFRQLRAILGSKLAHQAPHDAFVQRYTGGETRSDVANMHCARAVLVSEYNPEDRLNEGLIKTATGEDEMTARFLFKNSFTFRPKFKIWMASNYLPRVRGADVGFWRRFKLVPFQVSFEGRRDPRLEEDLANEVPGILAWAVHGCMAWRHDGGKEKGLGDAESVVQATNEYRSESDAIGQFIDACCVKIPEARVQAGALYREYRKWAESEGYNKPISNVAFGREVAQRFDRQRSNGKTYYHGIGLRAEES